MDINFKDFFKKSNFSKLQKRKAMNFYFLNIIGETGFLFGFCLLGISLFYKYIFLSIVLFFTIYFFQLTRDYYLLRLSRIEKWITEDNIKA